MKNENYLTKKAIAIDKEQTGYRINGELKRKFDNYCDLQGLNKGRIIERLMENFLKTKGNR